VTVSTVFLGLPYPSNTLEDDGCNFLFETMVFGADLVRKEIVARCRDDLSSLFGKFFGTLEVQRRYRTAAEARAGHAEMVRLAGEAVAGTN
jgi:hypothetical protein